MGRVAHVNHPQTSTRVRQVGVGPGYRHPKNNTRWCRKVPHLLRMGRVAHVNHLQTRNIVCYISVVPGHRHAVSSPARIISSHCLRIGWVADIDNGQASGSVGDKRVSVLNGHGIGLSARQQWPVTKQYGVEVKRQGAEADAAKRKRQKQPLRKTSPRMRQDVHTGLKKQQALATCRHHLPKLAPEPMSEQWED